MLHHDLCGETLESKSEITPLDYGFGRETSSYLWCSDCRKEVKYHEVKEFRAKSNEQCSINIG